MILRRRFRIPVLCAYLIILLIYRHHLKVAVNLVLEPLVFRYGNHSFDISAERDDFDVTFSRYSSLKANDNSTYHIPSIIHHILIGPMTMRPMWTKAIAACKQNHQEYEFKFWDDANAADFVKHNYPDIWPIWSGYKYNIQRADSLRYMILHHFGGTFLDLDLHCRRSLDPLRRFHFVAPAAHPAGISNGFLMSEPGLPFMTRVIDALKTYDLSWFGSPYLTVSFSTGCHFLS